MSVSHTAEIIRDLGDGLVLRRTTPADADALADFNSRIHGHDDAPDLLVGVWTRDLLTRPHPNFAPDDFTVVEETATGRIVSSLNLISQEWAYAGIPFGVGQPEAVGTLPEFRRRGLVRAQFDAVHQWSAARGQLVQVIGGIPFYYRQFGYEMGLALSGGRSGSAPHLPPLAAGEAEPYPVRPATPADIPFLEEVYAATVGRRELITCIRSAPAWRFELDGRSEGSLVRSDLRVITSAAGEPVGYLVHPPRLNEGGPGAGQAAVGYEVKPGVSLLAVTPSVIRYLWATGAALAAAKHKTLDRFIFALGAEHPVYDAFRDHLPVVRPPYAWYVRVPDLPAFLRRIAPALEAQLARSAAVGHTGELKLNFYHGGLRLGLTAGRLTTIAPWQAAVGENGDAAFPNLTFLQLLFGYRSLDELRHAYADCSYNGDATRVLLGALFPKQASNVWSLT